MKIGSDNYFNNRGGGIGRGTKNVVIKSHQFFCVLLKFSYLSCPSEVIIIWLSPANKNAIQTVYRRLEETVQLYVGLFPKVFLQII